jgi:hypothetical protein
MVYYFAWYSNESRRLRKKQAAPTPGNNVQEKHLEHVEIADVSEYKPRRIPSKQWRQCITRVTMILYHAQLPLFL